MEGLHRIISVLEGEANVQLTLLALPQSRQNIRVGFEFEGPHGVVASFFARRDLAWTVVAYRCSSDQDVTGRVELFACPEHFECRYNPVLTDPGRGRKLHRSGDQIHIVPARECGFGDSVPHPAR